MSAPSSSGTRVAPTRSSQRRWRIRIFWSVAALIALVVLIVAGNTMDTTPNSASASDTSTSASSSSTTTDDVDTDSDSGDDAGDTAGTDTQVHFLSNDATPGSNNFGPAVDCSDANDCLVQLEAIDRQDPLHFAVDEAFAKDGLQMSLASAQEQAAYYANHHDEWMTAVDDFVSKIDNIRLSNDRHFYRTLGMIPAADGEMPTLFRATEGFAAGKVFVFTYNGETRKLRLACGFQPEESITVQGPIAVHTVTEIVPPTPQTPETPPTTDTPPCTPIAHLQANEQYTDSTRCQVRTIVQPPQECTPIVPLPAGQHYTSDDRCNIAPNPPVECTPIPSPGEGYTTTDNGCTWTPPSSPPCTPIPSPGSGYTTTDNGCTWVPPVTPPCTPVQLPAAIGYHYTDDTHCSYEKDDSNTWDCQQNGGPNCPANPVIQPPLVPGNDAQEEAMQPAPVTAPVVLDPGPGAGSPPPAESSDNGYVPPAETGGAAPGGSTVDDGGTVVVAQPDPVIPDPAPCTTCGSSSGDSGSSSSGDDSGSTGSSGSDATTPSGATNAGDPGTPQG
ncbi:MAG: hypothetical protein JWM37_516 [Candidatus Saccharibacteria bacterium]|nr:hypothetical protein [Candidatus Saccharibacteria bacterium]